MNARGSRSESDPRLLSADLSVPILIAGAGLSGLSAAYHLERGGRTDYVLVEAEDRPGGWAKTDWCGEYGADRAIHVLYFRDDAMREWVEHLLDGRWIRHPKRCVIDSAGIRTPFPFHANLFGRDPRIIEECLSGMWEASVARGREATPASPATFAEWIELHYGAGVARHFMTPYNTKMWTVPPSMMGCDWMADFLPSVAPGRIVAGALGREDSRLGLNATFIYPRRGISELAEAIAARIQPIRYRTALVELVPAARMALLSDGTRVRYEHLISTLSLKQLADLACSLPPEVEHASNRLEAIDLVLVDVGFRDPATSDIHWAYLPDPEILAYRLHVCHAMSPDLAPPAHGLYCLEVSHSGHRPLPSGSLQNRIVEDLIRTRWLRCADQVTFYRERRFPCGYVLPRVGFKGDAAIIREYFRQQDVLSTGRFGEWKYANMEDALLDGKETAELLIPAEVQGR